MHFNFARKLKIRSKPQVATNLPTAPRVKNVKLSQRARHKMAAAVAPATDPNPARRLPLSRATHFLKFSFREWQVVVENLIHKRG